MNTLSDVETGGDGTDNEGGTAGCITADEDVSGVLGMLGLEEAHSEEHELCLDDFRFTGFDHDGATTVGIGFPVDGLYADTRDVTVLA